MAKATVRIVRTPEGAKKYGVPIGSVIIKGADGKTHVTKKGDGKTAPSSAEISSAQKQATQGQYNSMGSAKKATSDVSVKADTSNTPKPKSDSGPKTSSVKPLDDVNPTGTVFTEHKPEDRANAPLGKNMVSLDKTIGGSPDDTVKVYRGIPKDAKSGIQNGDFITTNKKLAEDYAGNGRVVSIEVRKGDVVDNKDDAGGEEYIYRKGADAETSHNSHTPSPDELQSPDEPKQPVKPEKKTPSKSTTPKPMRVGDEVTYNGKTYKIVAKSRFGGGMVLESEDGKQLKLTDDEAKKVNRSNVELSNAVADLQVLL